MDANDIKKMEDDFMGEDDDDVESLPMDAVGQEVDISKDGGVKKKILVMGDGWEQPQKGDKVRVHYVGTLEDGTKFDSSVDRDEPFEFKLGAGQVIKGWDVGVATMKKGEKALLTLQSDYGYGDNGSPPKIPPGATLLFEVELLSWASVNDLSPEKDGSILKSILKEADIGVWDRPQDNDIVTVEYSASIEGSEQPFVADAEAEFEVSTGHFCPAMEIVVKDMKLGEKVKAKVGPKYAFGDVGREGVPPGATVELTVELKHVKVVKFVDPNKVGTVVKTILTEGKNWQTPNDGASVTVSWTASLEDGTEFDKVENAELTIEDEQFPCEGLELAVSTMKAGEVADVVIKDPELGFGKAGVPDKVPGNAVVTYHVQLETFTGGPNVWEMSTAEKIALAEKRKLQGNKAFKEGKYERAQRIYRKAEETLSLDSKDLQDSERAKLKEIHMSCSLNQAATAIKLHDYRAAITAATKVLEKTPGHVKALFRRCQAYTETGDFVEAEADIKSALLMEPANVDLQAAKRKLKQRMKVQNKQDAKLFGAMFKSVGSLYKDTPAAKPIEEIGMDTGADEGNPAVPEVDMSADGEPEPLPVREAPIDSVEASPIAV